jgi:hypothetical protein
VRRRSVIFDDNDLIRLTLWHLFDQRGYEVFTFPEPGLCRLHAVQEFALMSGTFSAADLTRAENLGCKLFTKPLKMAEVVAWVESVERRIPVEQIHYDWA